MAQALSTQPHDTRAEYLSLLTHVLRKGTHKAGRK